MGRGENAVSVSGSSAALVGEVDSGGGCACVEAGVRGYSLPSSEFCYEPKSGKNSL